MNAVATLSPLDVRKRIFRALELPCTDAIRLKLTYDQVVCTLMRDLATSPIAGATNEAKAATLGISTSALIEWKRHRDSCLLFKAAAEALLAAPAIPWREVRPVLQFMLAKAALAANNNNHVHAARALDVFRNSIWNWEKQ